MWRLLQRVTLLVERMGLLEILGAALMAEADSVEEEAAAVAAAVVGVIKIRARQRHPNQ